MMKKWALGWVVAMAISTAAWAAPAPFGLEIGKATVSDLKNRHSASHAGTNAHTGGDMYKLDVSRIEFDGLKSVLVIFNERGQVEGVIATMDKGRFDAVAQGLAGKYKQVSRQIPFVGDKRIVWVDGGTEISLDAPHMSFEMTMQYVTKDLVRKAKNNANEDRKNKARSESSQL